MPTDSDRVAKRHDADGKKRTLGQIVPWDFVRLCLLAVVSLGIGAGINVTRKHPLSWSYRLPGQRLNATVLALKPAADSAAGGKSSPAPSFAIVGLEEFQGFVMAGQGMVIDARAEAFYQLGHVPGALSLPREAFASGYDRQRSHLEAGQAGEVIVYCSEASCPDAELVAGALARLGFRQLRIYKDGWEEWTRAGLPQEGGNAP